MTPIIEAVSLSKHFYTGSTKTSQPVRAVDGLNLQIAKGTTLGLVGESGSGKSTVGRLLLRLIEPTAGTIKFDGNDITKSNGSRLNDLRRRAQLIFQDPVSSFDPRKTIEESILEPLVVQGMGTKTSRQKRARELLDLVGIQSNALKRYPHQFSGGQAQRLGIARALTTNPDLIVCDEAVSALDVSVQAQVLNLLRELQNEFNLSYLFIAHDLNVVRYMSDRINVMYLGQIVEDADADEMMKSPKHPYTEALFNAIANPEVIGVPRPSLAGEIPSPSDPPSGCRFHPRCIYRFEPCDDFIPNRTELNGDRYVNCHLHDVEFCETN